MKKIFSLFSFFSKKKNFSNNKIKVIFWNTTFQADNLTLARYLSNHPDFEVAIALTEKDNLKNEPIHKLIPLHNCIFFDRNDNNIFSKIKEFDPVITIVDNHFPPKKLSKFLFVLWHGFGWKGPNDIVEFEEVHKSILKLTGFSATESNPYFRWQCFGQTDLEHRNKVSGFARENLLSLGSAFTDDLIVPKFKKEDIIDFYPENFKNKKIALIACTWHYGKMFSHWGDDIEILKKLAKFFKEKNYVMILRLHDKKRFETSYLEALENLAKAEESILLKFKDLDRDNLLDICVSDIMISNFSSILNYYYATLKPTIHIFPVSSDEDTFLWRTWKNRAIQIKEIPLAKFIWKLPLEENGGLLVHALDELFSAIDKCDKNPECCKEKSLNFLNKHIESVNGKTCERIADAIKKFINYEV